MKEDVKDPISLAEAADFAGVSQMTMRRWVRNGKLEHIRVGSKLFVRRADLQKALWAHRGRVLGRAIQSAYLRARARRGGQ